MTATALTPPRAAADRWAPVATPALYDVRIRHTRTTPLRNSFEYGADLWLVDLDDVAAGRLAADGPLPRWLRAQVRFEPADHLGDPTRSIKENVAEFARLHGVDDVVRVLMLASPRSGAGRLSHVFNPLSTHWCYRADGSLACLVAEVHNTYGERHAYLLRPDDAGRAEADKEFYVSPFFAVSGRYRMRFSAPGARLHVGMALTDGGRTPFTATVRGSARAATVRAIRAATLRRPMMALRVSALIRVQGVTLWLRGLPVVARTPHHAPAGVASPVGRTPAGTRNHRENRTGS
ncbi:DUF1365 domain-containing protein [Blastococcus jejuensis]|uniref:DUF1365 domain-containing protein n=1 Tax=Blastococcus jejuensis TaxID=351224 RepID=A0ABP6PHW2_9ACTN